LQSRQAINARNNPLTLDLVKLRVLITAVKSIEIYERATTRITYRKNRGITGIRSLARAVDKQAMKMLSRRNKVKDKVW